MDKDTALREEGLLSKRSFNYRTPRTVAFVFKFSFPYLLLRWAQAQGKGDKREGGRGREREGENWWRGCHRAVPMRRRVLQSHSVQLRQGEGTQMVPSEHSGPNSRESRVSV